MIRTPMWMGASAATLVFLLLAWVLPNLLGLQGGQLWILRSILAFLGLVAGFLAHRILAVREGRKGSAPKDPEQERIDLLLREARTRLESARGVAGGGLSRAPLLVVLGPSGSTKTTTVLQSGMEPELLAGEVHRGDTVTPTEAVNLWYAHGTVVVEAGAAALGDGDRWSRLMARLRPARLRAALLRKPQAPRVAVVCVACDDFLKPDASRSLPELARTLRGRLAEASRELGIQLPVYVLLTRADRLPYFEDFARALGPEEASEVLGATLPFRGFDSSGAYGDEQTGRLRRALEGLHRSLARKRLELLPREGSEEVRQAAYEFPREIRKLSGPIQEFLLELCRPGHLGMSPVLRGFYFTGVRAVLVDDGPTPAPEPHREARTDPATAGATQVFSVAQLQQESRQSAARSGGTRKVPQWVFLRRIFQDVILRDRIAMGLTGGGTRVNLLRRLALGGATAAVFVVLVGMTVSYVANRGLQQDVAAGLRGVEAVPTAFAGAGAGGIGGAPGTPGSAGADASGGQGPAGGDPVVPVASGGTEPAGISGTVAETALHSLRQLDELGNELDRLRAWEDGSPPLRFRWGLYRGSELLPEVRAAYFRRFRQVLWDHTSSQLGGYLSALPDEPGEDSDYEQVYNALKAYLMTTDHPEESTPGFLAPVLVAHSGRTGAEGEELDELLHRQFNRFAVELGADPPYPEAASGTLVAGTRTFLERFAAADQFYQALVSRVSSDLGTFRFSDVHPAAGGVLRSEYTVPGAFTNEGWRVVHEILADPEALLVSEEWVVGEQAIPPAERVTLAEELGERYVHDYIHHWQELLRTGSVRTFAAIPDAANALHQLSGNDSPVVHLLTQVSRNTSVDSDRVRAAFQPVHLLVPPANDRAADDGSGDGQPVRDYLDQLLNLQASLDQLPGASGSRLDQVLLQAERDASQVRSAVGQLSRDFVREGEARTVGDDVERILDEPVAFTTRLLGGYEQALTAQALNERSADFCARFNVVVALYPFTTGSGADAEMDDVKALFQPGESRLTSFHEEVMDELVTRQGGRYEGRSGANPAPSSSFLTFYNQAHRVAEALFDDGEGPRVRFFLRVEASERVPEIEVEVDGQSQVFTRTVAPTRDFLWNGEQARLIRISGQVDGERRTIVEAEGPWAVFRAFREASRWEELGGGTHRVAWSIPGTDLEVVTELNFAGPGHPVFRPDFLAAPRCVARVVG